MKWPMTENTENGDATKPTGPIEVWIRQKKATGFTCMIVYDDETTYEFDLVSRNTGRCTAGGNRAVDARRLSGGRWMESDRNFADIPAWGASARQASAPASCT